MDSLPRGESFHFFPLREDEKQNQCLAIHLIPDCLIDKLPDP